MLAAPCTSSSSYSSTVDSDKVKNPCATVDPNWLAFARSGSTWIHCWSPVRSANLSMWSCVISTHRLVPRSLPARVGRSFTLTVVVWSPLDKFGLPVSILQCVADVLQELRRHHAVQSPVVIGQP